MEIFKIIININPGYIKNIFSSKANANVFPSDVIVW